LKLFHKKIGNGSSIVILHGLYGSSDNWFVLGKYLSQHYTVFIPDLRNHGKSEHSKEQNYNVMAEDLHLFFQQNSIKKATIIGHSMGGKLAMKFANSYPEKIEKLIVVDISYKKYSEKDFLINNKHSKILEAISRFKLNTYSNRNDIETALSEKIGSLRTAKFISKNIKRTSKGLFLWKLNIEAITTNIEQLSVEINISKIIENQIPIYFIKGENSDYITQNEEKNITQKIIQAEIFTIKNAGHWLHAEQPKEFVFIINKILKINC